MGLLSYIYRSGDGDCTNGGISAPAPGRRGLCLVNVDGPFEPSDEYPPAMLVEHAPFGTQKGRVLARVVPAEQDEAGNWRPIQGWLMFGGNYCSTSDSRMGEHLRRILKLDAAEFPHSTAIAIHDRLER
jgi:hypothetical protein